MKYYFNLAFKNLKRRGLRSWLTLLGIFIGIASVVCLIGLGTALKDTVNAQFGISSTDLITIQAGGLNNYGPPGSGVVNPLTKSDLEEIKKVSLVEKAIGRNIETLKTRFNKKTAYLYFTTIPDDETRDYAYELSEITLKEGRFIESGDNDVAILGNDLLDKDKNGFEKALKIGDRIEVQGQNLSVIGILEKKGSFTIDSVILIQEKTLNKIITHDNNLDIIQVKIKSKEDMQLAKQEIEKLLRKLRDVKEGEEDFQVSTPEAALSSINQIIFGIQIFIILIASVSIVVGSIGVANTMYTSVLERKKEIGIMKAIGARNSDIFTQFLIEAGFLGLIGGLLGLLGGVAMSYVGVNVLNSLLGTFTKVSLNYLLFLTILIISFLIGSIAGLLPAMRAAKLNPIEALREA